MECPKEFTTESLSIADTIILIPKGELIQPYVKFITTNFKFETKEFNKNVVSDNHLLLLQLCERKKIIKIITAYELTIISNYLTVYEYDNKKLSRLIKLKNILEE
jgi:hypothetical protein